MEKIVRGKTDQLEDLNLEGFSLLSNILWIRQQTYWANILYIRETLFSQCFCIYTELFNHL